MRLTKSRSPGMLSALHQPSRLLFCLRNYTLHTGRKKYKVLLQMLLVTFKTYKNQMVHGSFSLTIKTRVHSICSFFSFFGLSCIWHEEVLCVGMATGVCASHMVPGLLSEGYQSLETRTTIVWQFVKVLTFCWKHNEMMVVGGKAINPAQTR